MRRLIGRKQEIKTMQAALDSPESEMIAVIGRRRVGKTFLIKSVYRDHIAFEMSGLQHINTDGQLLNFHLRMQTFFPDREEQKPSDWLTAFARLGQAIDGLPKSQEKRVIFFDEVPWMSTRKSGFLTGLSFFWNSWAADRNVVVVICGSAASWMIKKILQDRGGLHNRVTRRIRLHPFNLSETKAFLRSIDVKYNNREVLKLYMVMGGIPHYLKEVKPGESTTQAIDRICFSREGALRDEFTSLYPSLFNQSEYHVKIIRSLAKTQQGFTRQDILDATKIPDGGRVSTVLEELYESGFIEYQKLYGKAKRNRRYRLTDHYSIFYLKFIESNKQEGAGIWHVLSQSQAYKVWCGTAFETVCLAHIPQIKHALNIGGIYTTSATFYQQATESQLGAQVDLLLDRNDGIVNLFEMKFYTGPFTITKDYAEKLRRKVAALTPHLARNKRISMVLVTADGVNTNAYYRELIDASVEVEVLFTE